MTDTKNESKGTSGGQSNTSRTQSRQEREKKEFFREELKRLKEGLNREASKIQKPERKKHVPYIFTSLAPYYNVRLATTVIETQGDAPRGYTNRETAIGLCDPWVAHSMDQHVGKRSQVAASPQPEQGSKKEKKKKGTSKKNKEGSTRLPKFPAVSVPTGALATKTLTYSDVPMLRKELREKYSNNAHDKIQKEYTRTKQDFYRMDLDQMEEYHPINRDHMKAAYFAYLQNNPGSKKAIKECVKEVADTLGSPRSRPTSAVSQHSRPSSSRSRLSVKA